MIISPSIKFDPFAITDISKAILECVNNRTLNPSKPIIENKIDIAVKYLTQIQNKTLLITGGTGSFGNAVLNKFLDSDIKEIRIF